LDELTLKRELADTETRY